MKTASIILITTALVIAILFGGLYSVERSRSKKFTLQLAEAKQATVRGEQVVEETQKTAQMLEKKLEQMTAVLTNSTARLPVPPIMETVVLISLLPEQSGIGQHQKGCGRILF